MHLYAITRGIKKEVDDFITQLQGKYLPFKWREKETDPFKDMSVQFSVRPIQLWEFAFPEEHKDIVLATILGEDEKFLGDPKKDKWIKKMCWGLRKMLKVDPIPKFKKDNAMPICRQHMTVVGIGVKKDGPLSTGVEGI